MSGFFNSSQGLSSSSQNKAHLHKHITLVWFLHSTELICVFSFFLRFYLFIHEREKDRKAETQAEGEAGSTQGARRGTQSQVSRIRPWAEGGAKPLSQLGAPEMLFICADTLATSLKKAWNEASANSEFYFIQINLNWLIWATPGGSVV